MSESRKRKENKKKDGIKKDKDCHRRSYCRFRYTPEQLQDAVSGVQNGLFSISKASVVFNIPKGTLVNKVNNDLSVVSKMGPPSVLTIEEEKRLENWILGKAKLGFPLHHEDVKDAVQKILKTLNRPNPFTDDRPGRKWMELFLKRHPAITRKKPEEISKARALVTEEQLRGWFASLEKFLEGMDAKDILEDPSRIFNSDETGVALCPKTGKVLGPKKCKNFYVIAPGPQKENITVLCTFSANGDDVDPLILYAYKRIPAAISEQLPDGVAVGRSESGYMIRQTFLDYMINVFYPWCIKRQLKFPVVFLVDGHKSHFGLELYEFCKEKGIILYCLYPNSTHIIQVADVAVFKSLKLQWSIAVRQFKQKSNKTITKVNFASLFYTAYKRAIKKDTVMNGFEACGLYPFNPDRVDYSKCISTRARELSTNEHEVFESMDHIENELFFEKLQSEIPDELLSEFKEAEKTGQQPSRDQALYKIWHSLSQKHRFDTGNLVDLPESETKTLPEESTSGGVTGPTEKIDIDIADIPVIFDDDNLVLNTGQAVSLDCWVLNSNEYENIAPISQQKASPKKSPEECRKSNPVTGKNLLESDVAAKPPAAVNFADSKICASSGVADPWQVYCSLPSCSTTTDAEKKKRCVERVPFAITSVDFKDYCNRQKQKKDEKEAEINKRKEVRALKRAQKEELLKAPVKRKRGRPRKNQNETTSQLDNTIIKTEVDENCKDELCSPKKSTRRITNRKHSKV